MKRIGGFTDQQQLDFGDVGGSYEINLTLTEDKVGDPEFSFEVLDKDEATIAHFFLVKVHPYQIEELGKKLARLAGVFMNDPAFGSDSNSK